MKLLAAVTTAFFIIGCTSSSNDIDQYEQLELNSPITEYEVSTDNSGFAEFEVSIPTGSTAFQLVANSNSQYLKIGTVTAPNGAILFTGEEATAHTGQPLISEPPAVVRYPFTPIETSISGNHRIRIQALDKKEDPISGQSIRLSLISKNSRSANPRVNINVILAGSTADDRRNNIAIDDALTDVQSWYGEHDIILAINVIERADLPSRLPNPTNIEENSIYQELANQYPSAINMIFTNKVDNLRNPDNEFAQAGSIPLAAIPTGKSMIALSIRDLAGADGEFDSDRLGNSPSQQRFDNEVDQMASVIAHELGHALGLKNTVQIKGSLVVDTDQLSDTQSCSTEEACEAERGANELIMFPYTLRKEHGSGSFLVRNKLTAQQATIIRNSIFAIP